MKTDVKEREIKPMGGSTDTTVRYDISLLTADDLHLFNEGTHFHLYEKLGSHLLSADSILGAYFAVWAPDAERVSVMGNFNGWNKGSHPLRPRGRSGIWEGFIPGIQKGEIYKYFVESRYHCYKVEKADPFAVHAEIRPKTASVVWDLDYSWNDEAWMKERKKQNSYAGPISIYEVHLASWRRVPEENHRSLSYREAAPLLVDYVKKMGFTHIQFLPLMEHPFGGSWGYQTTGYFAPTSRHGTPQDFMYLVDCLHRNGIGVILDWVPSHFPTDAHGLGYFDGTHLYEHDDMRKGFHPDWSSFIFNYGRNEVKSFLISSALYWLGLYHVDGLRVDAVASMLYLDYSRKDGDWIPNVNGGRENLPAIDFIKQFNEAVYKFHPDVQTIAEESTAWTMVSRPTYAGGLGFGMKWDMGWMHDTLEYITKDPIYRKFHQTDLTFRMLYAYTENFVLSLSHDEVVHGKKSLLDKMPGDPWQKFANLRILFGYMYGMTGKKLFFMGGEFGQWWEWNHEESIQWHLLEYAPHASLQKWVMDLNHTYRAEPALYELDCDPAGFEWIDCNDHQHSVISFIRKGKSTNQMILVALNFTPTPRYDYILGVPRGGYWKEILNSDAEVYGGSGHGNKGGVHAASMAYHNRPCSVTVTLPPLGAIFLKSES